jgi:hypothetical protein
MQLSYRIFGGSGNNLRAGTQNFDLASESGGRSHVCRASNSVAELSHRQQFRPDALHSVDVSIGRRDYG